MNTENLNIENIDLKTPETERGDLLILEILKYNHYRNLPDHIVTPKQNEALAKKIEELADSLQVPKNPETPQDVVLLELHRRLTAEKKFLLSRVSPEIASWEEIVAILGIPEQDLEGIEIWLKDHLENVKETNDHLLQNAQDLKPHVGVDLGIEELRYRAQNSVTRHLEVLKDILRSDFSDLPGVNLFLDRYLIALNEWNQRSYINRDTHVLSIGVGSCVKMYHNEISVVPEEIIRLFGHEGMGHGQQFVVTEEATFLPLFLRTNTGTNRGSATISAEESVAMHFERKLFDYLKFHPTATKQLEFQENFDQIYRRYMDNSLLKDYWSYLNNYGRLVLAKNGKPDLKNGKPQNESTAKTMQELTKYSIDPQWPTRFIKDRENLWDPVTGRLSIHEISELRYATNSVQRIMEKATPEQVPIIEKLILTGLWTPEGLEQWVKVNLG